MPNALGRLIFPGAPVKDICSVYRMARRLPAGRISSLGKSQKVGQAVQESVAKSMCVGDGSGHNMTHPAA